MAFDKNVARRGWVAWPALPRKWQQTTPRKLQAPCLPGRGCTDGLCVPCAWSQLFEIIRKKRVRWPWPKRVLTLRVEVRVHLVCFIHLGLCGCAARPDTASQVLIGSEKLHQPQDDCKVSEEAVHQHQRAGPVPVGHAQAVEAGMGGKGG
eukprot:scaffold10912_cov63-Isochrysis_galbana.AAC.2